MNEVDSIEKLETALAESGEHPILLFKHSTRCGISARANARMTEYLESKGNAGPDVRVVKVVEDRSVSDAVTDRLGVGHESPQVILLKDGQSAWNASHHNIRGDTIDAALSKVQQASSKK